MKNFIPQVWPLPTPENHDLNKHETEVASKQI